MDQGEGRARQRAADGGVPDFRAAAALAFEDLRARTGLERWWVDRRRGDERVVIAATRGDDATGATARGRSWDDAAALGSGARVVVPVPGRGGAVLGALCGASDREVTPTAEQLRGVRTTAALLGALLDQEIRLDDEVRRAERAEAAAHTDPLTGLGNRRAWDAALGAEDERAARHGSPAAVVALDVDGLKQINDTLGHDAGDEALRRTAAVLTAQVRTHDVVVRLGGDEFAVLLPDTERTTATAVVARVRAALAAEGLSASAGVGSCTGGSGLFGAWRDADEAAYADKRAHRGRRGASLAVAAAWEHRPAPGTPRAAPGAAGAERVGAALTADRGVDALLRVALAQLGADVAVISAVEGSVRRLRNVVAQVRVPFAAGACEPHEGTVCDLLERGRVPRVVPDTAASVLADHPAVRDLAIRSHVGVLLHRADGSRYGTLCAWSSQPDRHLAERDGDVLDALGAAVMGLVEAGDAAEAGERGVRESVDALLSSGGVSTTWWPVVHLADARPAGLVAQTAFPPGTLPGREWFAAARGAGCAERLELAALDDALRGLALLPPGGSLVVGASATTASAPGLLRRLQRTDPSRLVLQVRGDADPDELRRLRAVLAPARRDGLRLAVAAAGTARNGGEHLLALGADVVGVHPGVVSGVAGSLAQQALLRGLVAFTETLGAQLLAGGAHTDDDVAWLRSAGVALAHGRTVGEPVGRPADLVAPAR